VNSSTLSLTLTLDGVGVVSTTHGPFHAREKDLVPILRDDGWARGPV